MGHKKHKARTVYSAFGEHSGVALKDETDALSGLAQATQRGIFLSPGMT
jgi:hypothetical protein